MTTFDYVRIGVELLIIPALGMVWNIQGRISKLEGIIEAFIRDIEKK